MTSFAAPSMGGATRGAASSTTHRLLRGSAKTPWLETMRSRAAASGRHSFHASPGYGSKLPSGIASITEGAAREVQRGKLANTLPRGDTATPFSMNFGDAATRTSSG